MKYFLHILVIFAILALPVRAQALIAFVSCTSNSGSGTTLAVTRSVTAGNGLVALMAAGGAGQFSSPTMTSETPILISTTFTSVNSNIQLLYVANLSSTASKTLNVTIDTSVSWSVQLCEFSGQDTTTFYDSVYATQSGTSSSCTMSLTTATDNSLIVGNWSHNGNAGDTAGSGYTLIELVDIGRNAGEHNVDTGTAGSKTVNATCNNAANWGMQAAAFKPASAGAECGGLLLMGVGC